MDGASRPASPVISPPPRREPVTVRSSLVCAHAGRAVASQVATKCTSAPRCPHTMMFKFGYIGRFSKGYEAMGYIIIASSIFSVFMRIKGQKTMFGTLEDQ